MDNREQTSPAQGENTRGYTVDELLAQMEPQYQAYKNTMRQCIAGLTEHAARLAAQGQEEQLPTFRRLLTDMAEFWGLAEDDTPKGYREMVEQIGSTFDQAVSAARDSGGAPELSEQTRQNMVANTLPQKKEDEIVDRCRELLRAIRKHPNFETIHDWNTYVVGIHNYYKGMSHFCMNFRKIGWRIKKLFYHTMERNVTFTQEQSYKNNFQRGGYRSWGSNGYYCFNGYPIVEIQWASWDNWLLAGGNGVVRRENPYSQKKRQKRPGVSIDDIEYLVRVSKHIKNSRLALFRISKYSSTKGISYLSGEYVPVGLYHCHHIKPLKNGGTNDFNNLCVLSELEHTILHSTTPERLYDLFPKKKKRIKALIEALYDKAA